MSASRAFANLNIEYKAPRQRFRGQNRGGIAIRPLK
jgi:hypothetical protein